MAVLKMTQSSAQELFYCQVPSCNQISNSKIDLDLHVATEHGYMNNPDSVDEIEKEFQFEEPIATVNRVATSNIEENVDDNSDSSNRRAKEPQASSSQFLQKRPSVIKRRKRKAMRSILLKKRRDMQKEDRSVENYNSNSVIATFDDVEVEKVKESEERQQMKSNKSLSSFTIEKVKAFDDHETADVR